MATNYEYTNGLGIGVTYGPYQEQEFGTSVSTFGVRKQVLIPYGKNTIPKVQDNVEARYNSPEAAARDPEGDSLVAVIPPNSFITSARFYTYQTFEDGTTVSVGANDSAGDGNDAGFVGDVGSTAAGTWTEGDGAYVGTTTGEKPLQFSSSADSVNTGEGVLILEYIEPPVV